MLNIIKTLFLSDKYVLIKNGIMLLCYISFIISLYMLYFIHIQMRILLLINQFYYDHCIVPLLISVKSYCM